MTLRDPLFSLGTLPAGGGYPLFFCLWLRNSPSLHVLTVDLVFLASHLSDLYFLSASYSQHLNFVLKDVPSSNLTLG